MTIGACRMVTYYDTRIQQILNEHVSTMRKPKVKAQKDSDIHSARLENAVTGRINIALFPECSCIKYFTVAARANFKRQPTRICKQRSQM